MQLHACACHVNVHLKLLMARTHKVVQRLTEPKVPRNAALPSSAYSCLRQSAQPMILYQISACCLQVKLSFLVVGLANSGKTSIVSGLRADPSPTDTVPTVGFSVEKFRYRHAHLTVMDMSGAQKYHKLWECYYADVQVSCRCRELLQRSHHRRAAECTC